MSRRIRTYDELDKIEDKAYAEACSGDLFFIRHCEPCIDGYFLIVSRDDTESMKKGTYYIKEEDIQKWPLLDKKAFIWKYHVNIAGVPNED